MLSKLKSKKVLLVFGLACMFMILTIILGSFNHGSIAHASSGSGQIPYSWVENYAGSRGMGIVETIAIDEYNSNPQDGDSETITRIYVLKKNTPTIMSSSRIRDIVFEHTQHTNRVATVTFEIREETANEIKRSLSLAGTTVLKFNLLELAASNAKLTFSSEEIGVSTSVVAGYNFNNEHASGLYKVSVEMNKFFEYHLLKFSETRTTHVTSNCDGTNTSFSFSHELVDTLVYYSAMCDNDAAVSKTKIS